MKKSRYFSQIAQKREQIIADKISQQEICGICKKNLRNLREIIR